MRTQFLKTSFFILSVALFFACFTSCLDKDVSDNINKPEVDEYFDFAMKSEVTLDVNYNLSAIIDGGYQVIFNLYDVDPFIYDEKGNSSLKEGIKPIYSAWTDNTGKFNKEIALPTAVKEVEVRSYT